MVTDDSDPAIPLEGAIIEIEGIDETLVTDASGQASIVLEPGSYQYTVLKNCFQSAEGEFMLESSSIFIQVMLEGTPGDANDDGIVNVLDVITMVSYFVGEHVETFCFNNADVNHDGVVNVLDVIIVVNIFAEGKKFPYIGMASADAHIYMHNDGISILSDGTLAGLQFELIINDARYTDIQLLLPYHELAYTIKGNVLRAMIFSLNNTPIPDGIAKLIAFKNETNDWQWGGVLAGNMNADVVTVHKHTDMATSVFDGIGKVNHISVYPNPASNRLYVEFENTSTSPVRLLLMNAMGQISKSVSISKYGHNVVMLHIDDLTKGTYFLKLENKNGIHTEKVLLY